jgi:hypothetical protein
MKDENGKWVVHCPTEYYAKKVYEDYKGLCSFENMWYKNCSDLCISINDKTYSSLSWYQNCGYKIISAQEYLINKCRMKEQEKKQMTNSIWDEKTTEAIIKSVKIYQRRAEGEIVYASCPLCALFESNSCINCPLNIRGMNCNKNNSVWQKYNRNKTPENAQYMLLALKSLFYPEDTEKFRRFEPIKNDIGMEMLEYAKKYMKEYDIDPQLVSPSYHPKGAIKLHFPSTNHEWTDAVIELAQQMRKEFNSYIAHLDNDKHFYILVPEEK